jgi:signal transduction histidine kinase
MTTSAPAAGPEAYGQILSEYLQTRGEEALYHVSLLSQAFIESGLGPEDIIALHFESLDTITARYSHREQVRASGDAQQFLLEVMIAYGVKFKEYLELKLREGLRDAEAQAAQERARALDAERVGRQKDDILRVIAHELRTPLAAVQGNLDYARRLITQGRVERLPALIETASEALDRLSRLSADLVEASRGQMPTLRFARRELNQILAQACAWAESTAAANQVALIHEPGEALFVRADGDALLSVFGNLLSNAIRYTPPGGRVSVRSGANDGWAWTEVDDTGIGMSPEVQARVFEKFYRAPEARSVEGRGLGLGLSLVLQMVQAHEGQIEIKSGEGRGSTFRVHLPLANDLGEEEADD